MLTERQTEALRYIVDNPGTAVLMLPWSKATIGALERLGLVARSRLGSRMRESALPSFVWPMASALLVTGELTELRRLQ